MTLTVRIRRLARALTWLYAIAAVVALGSWLVKPLFSRSAHPGLIEVFFSVINVPATASLASFVVLSLVTLGLLHRKKLALLAVAIFQVLGLIASILTLLALVDEMPISIGQQPVQTLLLFVSILIAVAALVVVWRLRPAFPAPVARGSWTLAILTLVEGMVATVIIVALLVLLTPGPRYLHTRKIFSALKNSMALPWHPTWAVPVAPYISGLGSIMLGITVVLAVHAFLRASKPTDSWSAENELHARKLLAQFGEEDSLGYSSLRRDKLLHFSPNRNAAIAYQVFGSVALASGDPIGDPAAWVDAVQSFEARARHYGWTPAVIACSERGARVYSTTCGYDVIRLGDEAILHPKSYDDRLTSMEDVRKAVRRCRKGGLTCSIGQQQEFTGPELLELLASSDRWRHGKTERGFSMALGRFGDASDPRIVIARVLDADGTLLALMTFLPWGRHGLSLDLMRRHPDAPNGVNEFLVHELMLWCAERGVEKVSLNFAFLRHVFADAEFLGASRRTKLNSRVIGSLDRFWQLQRLYRANAKYLPEWSPRYVVLPSAINLVSVGLASAIAEGFLPSWLLPHAPIPTGLQLGPNELQRAIDIEQPRAPHVMRHLSDQERQRERAARELEAAGMSPHPVGAISVNFLDDAGTVLAATGPVRIAGRIRSIRDHGKVCFADLVHGHEAIQLIVEGAAAEQFSHYVHTGDLIDVTATAGQSRNRTPSLIVNHWQMLAKCYRPVPWHGLHDPQTRLRNRALDLIVHPGELDVLHVRSRAIQAVRSAFLHAGYTEVETPILQSIHGGASARPFTTKINAYNTELVLRIAPELALKKLVVAGMGPVFEIGRNFRNEGADASHNPEFTVVEAYCPFSDYHGMRELTQRVVQATATAVHGSPVLRASDGSWLDISGTWRTVSVCDAVSEAVGVQISLGTDPQVLLDIARRHGLEVRPEWGPGALIEELYGELVEPATVAPTFYMDFPLETSPLTASHRTIPGLVERWDLVACGMELGTAYSELTDPLEQRRRLMEQSWKAARGDAEAMEVDEDFLRALEVGMPPSGGLGIGLDRLLMALTGLNIRQVLAFPYVKPETRV